jgi:hypothetical protein
VFVSVISTIPITVLEERERRGGDAKQIEINPGTFGKRVEQKR